MSLSSELSLPHLKQNGATTPIAPSTTVITTPIRNLTDTEIIALAATASEIMIAAMTAFADEVVAAVADAAVEDHMLSHLMVSTD